MNILYYKESFIEEDNVIALGYFDGIHLGHQQVLNKTIEISKKRNIKSTLLTFDSNPKAFLSNEPISYLTSLQQKINMAKSIGFDNVIILPCNKQLINLSKEQFIEDVLLANNVKYVVCGYDFKFGKNGTGNTTTLEGYNTYFDIEIISPMLLDSHRVSSTLVKELLRSDLNHANSLLGYPYTIQGEVVKGMQRGKSIVGFATANVNYMEHILLQNGVYGVQVYVHNKAYIGMANIGFNPTFGDIKKPTLEVHIFDFDQMIYGDVIDVSFCFEVRKELKFDSVEQLSSQLQEDQKQIIEIFKKEA